jgi:hypothetical protein
LYVTMIAFKFLGVHYVCPRSYIRYQFLFIMSFVRKFKIRVEKCGFFKMAFVCR